VPNTPVVAYSGDGSTWDDLDTAVLPEEQVAWLSGVFAGPEGIIVVGSHVGNGLLVWHSSDGRTWTDTDLPTLRGGSVAVTAASAGWIAVTAGGENPVEVAVWASSDGVHWSETETETTPRERAVRAYIGTAPLVDHDGTWVLATSSWPGSPTVWVSTDDGRNWTEQTVASDSDAHGFQTHDATSTAFGLILAGTQDFSDEEDSGGYLHHSQDGDSWNACWTIPLEFTQLVAFGDTIAAYDYEFGDVYTWHVP
jgi:hypothetical protein